MLFLLVLSVYVQHYNDDKDDVEDNTVSNTCSHLLLSTYCMPGSVKMMLYII